MPIYLSAKIAPYGSNKMVDGKSVDISTATDGSSYTIQNDDIFLVDDGAQGTEASTYYVTGTQLKAFIASGNIVLGADTKVVFGNADEYIKGDGTDLFISSTSNVNFNGSRLIGASRFTFNDGGATADIIRDEDDMTSNDANALATQQSIKAYVDTNKRWHQHTGGYKLNNSSSATYYFQYRFGDHNWSNSDSSPTTISVYDSYASIFIAPYAGTLDKISVHGYAVDTGATDPFKFYVFKGTPVSGNANLSLTQIGVTAEVTPADTRQFAVHTSISSSNTFARNDSLFVMYKKESSSASQDLYFSVTISGVYTE